ncbi:hypothetical protein [Protaetiibacter larvae]|uniref:Uncharacterized protein n=1 Tax=Protaetiibacter larvae TaxID=2592654 RepID=A0A5C1YBB8_9MICO|nr:hypothetical protein [Protaetiibacter larvae]QEO10565.1 hypothetical protein FLP23_11470 [Protaetiibacter larvae]
MAAKNTDNLTAALDALTAEAGAAVEKADLPEYLKRLDAVIDAARAVKATHAKAVRVAQSQASRARKKERVEKALALLAEQEAAAAKA